MELENPVCKKKKVKKKNKRLKDSLLPALIIVFVGIAETGKGKKKKKKEEEKRKEKKKKKKKRFWRGSVCFDVRSFLVFL